MSSKLSYTPELLLKPGKSLILATALLAVHSLACLALFHANLSLPVQIALIITLALNCWILLLRLVVMRGQCALDQVRQTGDQWHVSGGLIPERHYSYCVSTNLWFCTVLQWSRGRFRAGHLIVISRDAVSSDDYRRLRRRLKTLARNPPG